MTGLVAVDPAVVLDAVRGTRFAEREVDGIRISRLPDEAVVEVPAGELARVASQAAGVHLAFRTAAKRFALRARFARILRESDPADRLLPVVVATIDGREVARAVVPFTAVHRLDDAGHWRFEPADPASVALEVPPEGSKDVDIWLPHAASVEGLVVEADADVVASPRSTKPRWVHYGSSISHCVEAPDPLSTWPALAAAQLGWDSTNLGVSGQAMLDPAVGRVIRDLPADIITVKVGINPVNAGSMTRRHFEPLLHEFAELIGSRHPKSSLIVISPIICPIHEEAAGPTRIIDGRAVASEGGGMSLRDVRAAIDAVVTRRGLAFIDGRELLGSDDADLLVDGLHPGLAGYRLIAARFAQLMRARHPVAFERRTTP